jgi:hypothetical protein
MKKSPASQVADQKLVQRGQMIEECAKVAEAAADEWWKSLKAKDEGKPSVDFGSLPDHMVNKIRALVHRPAEQPE